LAILLFLISCEKDPLKGIPDWLRIKINQEEQIIKDNPRLMNSYGAWIRYQWQDDYYYEYWNPVSSSSPEVFSQNGDILQINPWDATTDYYKEKCCRQIIWKAPKYSEPI
jgi:hypothetical protein